MSAPDPTVKTPDAAANSGCGAMPCSPVMTRYWTLLFETHDGMCHPTRITFRTEGTEADARRHGSEYMQRESRWLKSICDCYPTEIKS